MTQSSMGYRRAAALVVVAAGLMLTLQGGWIQTKAALAQFLLQAAWAQTLEDGERHRPWPWADHWPVARLRHERLGIDQIVLHGDSGAVLAFAPGVNPRSTLPPGPGAILISGHRDTHFAFLQQVNSGDVVTLETPTATDRYEVGTTKVVDSRTTKVALSPGEESLYLATCYPFDALDPGGPMRFVATAYRVN